jgi:hypothetical protein
MHNFYGIQNKVNTFRKGLNFDRYDEPTWLTFSIDFRFEESPTFGDVLWSSPLFAKPDAANSAQRYFGSVGHKDKEAQIKTFKEILEYLTFNAPWYFQSISGLDSLWTKGTDIVKATKETTITINTLEAVDLRITELANLYRGAIFDKTHLKERLPDNLQWFAMDIYVAEVRNIRYTLGGNTGSLANTFGIGTAGVNTVATQLANSGSAFSSELDVASVLKQFGYIKFKCRQCTFDFSKSFAGGSGELGVSPSSSPATNKFDIKIGFFEEESEYRDGTKLIDDPSISEVNNPWSQRNLNSQGANFLNSASNLPLVGGAVQSVADQFQSSLQSIGGLINPSLAAATQYIAPASKNLGNIYGG